MQIRIKVMNDADFACGEEEKRLNRDFYKLSGTRLKR